MSFIYSSKFIFPGEILTEMTVDLRPQLIRSQLHQYLRRLQINVTMSIVYYILSEVW